MRYWVLAALLAGVTIPARAETVDCRDYVERYDAQMEEVRARAPGNEPDARREKAEAFLKECRRLERREARQAREELVDPAVPRDCIREDGKLYCR